jgi:copper(I)-binding protein
MPSLPRIAAPLVALVAALALALVACGSGHGSASAEPGTLRLVDVRVDRPLTDQTAVRLVVRNGTATADALTGVSSPDASGSEIHRTIVDSQDRSRMDQVAQVPIPARSDVTFEPGGLHVMLTGLKKDLAIGDHVTVTFRFAHAGTRTIRAVVVRPGTDPQMEHDHG